MSRAGVGACSDDGTQELCEPSQEETEVVAGCSEDGVDAIAKASLETVAVHAVPGHEVADDGPDGRARLYLASDGSRDAAGLRSRP